MKIAGVFQQPISQPTVTNVNSPFGTVHSEPKLRLASKIGKHFESEFWHL